MAYRRVLSLFLALTMFGCAGSKTAGDAPNASPDAQAPWFCSPAAEGDDWRCVESTTPVAQIPMPRPSAPASAPSDPAPVSASTAPTAPQSAPPAPVAQAAAPPPVAITADTVPASNDASAVANPPAAAANGKVPMAELPGDYFVVQLIALSDKTALQTLATHLNVPNLSAAVVETGGKLYYILLLGAYPDRATAEHAIANRPEPLRQFEPWVRSIGSLKDGMWRAQSLTASLTAKKIVPPSL